MGPDAMMLVFWIQSFKLAFYFLIVIKKAEHQKTDAFELWCWRRLLRVPWTARRSNQSILKEINPEYSLEGLILKLKLQPFGHLIRRIDSFEKTLMLGMTEVGRRRGQQRIRWLDGITAQWTWAWVNSGSWWWTGRHGILQSMRLQTVRHDGANELNWTEPFKWNLVKKINKWAYYHFFIPTELV